MDPRLKKTQRNLFVWDGHKTKTIQKNNKLILSQQTESCRPAQLRWPLCLPVHALRWNKLVSRDSLIYKFSSSLKTLNVPEPVLASRVTPARGRRAMQCNCSALPVRRHPCKDRTPFALEGRARGSCSAPRPGVHRGRAASHLIRTIVRCALSQKSQPFLIRTIVGRPSAPWSSP